MRFYNGAGLKATFTPTFLVLAEFDYGTQGRASESGSTSWYGGMLTGRYQATPMAAIVGRVERYADRDQTIVVTGRRDGLQANGLSLGLDIAPQARVLFRTELRGLQGARAVFPTHDGRTAKSDAFVVSSLALTF